MNLTICCAEEEPVSEVKRIELVGDMIAANLSPARDWETSRVGFGREKLLSMLLKIVLWRQQGRTSALNRKETLQYTAGFLWLLNLPDGKISRGAASLPGNIAGGTIAEGSPKQDLIEAHSKSV